MNKVTRSFVVRCAALMFVAFCFFTIIRLQFKNNEVAGDINKLNEQIAEAEQKLDELKRQAEEPIDEDYIEDVARQELDLRHPDEFVFYNDN